MSFTACAFWVLLIGGVVLIWLGCRKPRQKWRSSHDWRNDNQWKWFV